MQAPVSNFRTASANHAQRVWEARHGGDSARLENVLREIRSAMDEPANPDAERLELLEALTEDLIAGRECGGRPGQDAHWSLIRHLSGG